MPRHGRTLAPFSGLLLAVIAAMLLGGCATTDESDNISERPWNAPKSWEHGLPAGMTEGR